MNERYTLALQELIQTAGNLRYIIVGSIALLSYTQNHGYEREVHDIDLLAEKETAETIRHKLLDLGYSQGTFITNHMPFYSYLLKHSPDRYLRFTKDNVAIELLSTDWVERNGLLVLEVYPGIQVGIPKEELVTSKFNGVTFSTLSKDLLYLIKQVANNSFGLVAKYKNPQSLTDVTYLKSLVDQGKLAVVGKKCRLFLGGLAFKVPKFMYK